MSAACARAQMLAGAEQPEALTLADAFCRQARLRIRRHFAELFSPTDATLSRLARQVLDGRHAWLEHGIVGTAGSGEQVAGSGNKH